MSKVVELLTEARKLVKRGWCRQALAVDKEWVTCPPGSPKACRWCATGAVQAASWALGYGTKVRFAALESLRKATRIGIMPSFVPIEYNDDVISSQAEALAWFDKAIKEAQA